MKKTNKYGNIIYTNEIGQFHRENGPARIACRVSSKIDSRIVMDGGGAEKLSGYGDALLSDSSRTMERFQIAYTDAEEICKKFLK